MTVRMPRGPSTDQWLERPGYPVLGSTTEWDAQAGEARITVVQKQTGDWPLFRFPLEIEVRLPDGERERTRIEMEGRSSSISLRLPVSPESVRLDPDGWLLHGLS
jgi:aminopeptidase N